MRLISLLNHPLIYEAFQRFVGKEKLRRRLIRGYIQPNPGDLLLDLGCGPGDLVRHCQGLEYVGFDVDSAYIEAARARFGGVARFYDGSLDSVVEELHEKCDVSVLVGVLHHVPDDVASEIIMAARACLKPGGRFFAAEPHVYTGQHPVARALIARDRGQFVRDELSYADLVGLHFDDVRVVRDEHMLRVPYAVSIYCAQKDTSPAES